MNKLFLSYAREDLEWAEELSQQLQDQGVVVLQDKVSLFAGQKWPKKLGEAIAANDFFLLVWSKAAAQSCFVEFEWTTATALKKPVLACPLDNTPLPLPLRSVQSFHLKEPLQLSIPDLLHTLKQPFLQPTVEHREEVIAKLAEVSSDNPQEVIRQAQNLFHQQGWTVEGSVYQASGDLHNNTVEKGKDKFKLDRWVKIVTLVSLLIGIGISLFTLRDRIVDKFFPETATIHLRGMVTNSQNKPVSGATIWIFEHPDFRTTTTSDGGFHLPDIPGQPGDRVRVYVKASGHEDHNEYVALPGPIFIRLGE
jgi:hypothetical protein